MAEALALKIMNEETPDAVMKQLRDLRMKVRAFDFCQVQDSLLVEKREQTRYKETTKGQTYLGRGRDTVRK